MQQSSGVRIIFSNPRHERFAQELTAGKAFAEAYELAGFKANRGNALRLKDNEQVMRRVAELQARGAERAEVRLVSLLAELEEARQLALSQGQASAAVQASMGKARLTGHVVDRREVGSPGEFAEMSDAELIAKAKREARELGLADPTKH